MTFSMKFRIGVQSLKCVGKRDNHIYAACMVVIKEFIAKFKYGKKKVQTFWSLFLGGVNLHHPKYMKYNIKARNY